MRKIIMLLIALFTAGVLHAAEKKSVLAIGDSITQGGGNFVCYRQVLVLELQKQGFAVEFIGPQKDATSCHAGYGGKNTGYLRSISQATYQQYPADIVLIHSGHNSFSKDKPVPGIIEDTKGMIENIIAINPKVTILLAQVITSGKLPKYSYIPDLNSELVKLAQEMTAKGYKIILVNQADGFDWKTDTVKDMVHPNASGAKKMADKWMTALLPLISKQSSCNPIAFCAPSRIRPTSLRPFKPVKRSNRFNHFNRFFYATRSVVD